MALSVIRLEYLFYNFTATRYSGKKVPLDALLLVRRARQRSPRLAAERASPARLRVSAAAPVRHSAPPRTRASPGAFFPKFPHSHREGVRFSPGLRAERGHGRFVTLWPGPAAVRARRCAGIARAQPSRPGSRGGKRRGSADSPEAAARAAANSVPSRGFQEQEPRSWPRELMGTVVAMWWPTSKTESKR